MPTYVYRREDGSTFEIKQRITEDPLESCPDTGQSVKRLITGSTGLIFKGEGFYVNDYGRGNGGRKAGANGAKDNGASGSNASDGSASGSDASAAGASTTDA